MKYLASLLALLPLGLSVLHGQELAISFIVSNGSSDADNFASAPPGIVGKTPHQWNLLTFPALAASAKTFQNLKLVDGSATEISLQASPGYTASNGIFTASKNRDFHIMDSWIGIRGTEKLTLSNLPFNGTYTVEIYGDSNDTNRTMNYVINGVTATIVDSGTFSGTFAERTGFKCTFPAVTGRQLEITGNNASQTRSAISAIRIIQNTAPKPVIDAFASTDENDNVTFSWETRNASGITVSPPIDGVSDLTSRTAGGKGSMTSPYLSSAGTYTLTATNEYGSCDFSITVNPPSPKINEFKADKQYLTNPEDHAVTLSWKVRRITSLTLNDGSESVPVQSSDTGEGSHSVAPDKTTTYTLTGFSESGESVSSSLTVYVSPHELPNIVIFLVDDMGWQDTSVPFHYQNGQPVKTSLNNFYKTPNMESLAAQGIKFTNAYAAPLCSPSRVSLMLGKEPVSHRVTTWTALQSPVLNDEINISNMRGPDWNMAGLPEGEITLPQMMKRAGYRTIHVGKAHFAPNNKPFADPRNIGFDINIAGSGLGGPGSYRSDENFKKGNAAQQVPGMEEYWTSGTSPTEEEKKQNFLTRALTTEMNAQIAGAVQDGVPFFAYMSHYAVHATHEDPDPNADKNAYNTLPSVNQGISVNQGTLRNFATLIEGMDQSLGLIRQNLRDLGIARNTLIIFLSDNGGDAPIQQNWNGNMSFIEQIGAVSPLRGRKGSRFEGGSRIPMIIAWAEEDTASPIQQIITIPQNSRNDDIVAIWDIYPTIMNIIGMPIEHEIDGSDITGYITGGGTASSPRPQEILHHFPHSHTYAQFYTTYREGDWKIHYLYRDQYNGEGVFPWRLYNLKDDISESNDLAQDPQHQTRLMKMAREMFRKLAAQKAQYPYLRATSSGPILGTAYPRMPDLPKIDSDGDGIPDLLEDTNKNGLIDEGETDPDDAASFFKP